MRVEDGIVYLDAVSASLSHERFTLGRARNVPAWVVRLGRSDVHPTTGQRCTPAYYGGACVYMGDDPNPEDVAIAAWEAATGRQLGVW